MFDQSIFRFRNFWCNFSDSAVQVTQTSSKKVHEMNNIRNIYARDFSPRKSETGAKRWRVNPGMSILGKL